MPSRQCFSDLSGTDSRVNQHCAHYWLPNGILQEVEKQVDRFEKDQVAIGRQSRNLYWIDEYKCNEPQNLALTCLHTWPNKLKSSTVLGNYIKGTDKQNVHPPGSVSMMLSDPLQNFKCELYKLWHAQQTQGNRKYLPKFERDSNIVENRHLSIRDFAHKPIEYNGKPTKALVFDFNPEDDEQKETRQKPEIDRDLGSKLHSVHRKQAKKLPYCRHYNDGYCKRGNNCEFQHVLSVVYPDAQKVFLGGLPLNITQRELSEKMKAQGFNVINEPSIMHKYAPQVCLRSPEEAQRLINMGTIMIDGEAVDVRRYEAVTKKQQERLADITRRSVFLGGLEKETTPKIIRCELAMIGMKVVNHLTIKSGFCPQVTLATSEQACTLVCKVKVQIKGKWVNVRPYVPKLLE